MPGTVARAMLHRLVLIPPAVALACLLCLLGLRHAPGEAFAVDQGHDPVRQARLAGLFGLDDPWHVQWWDWWSAASRGDLGESWHHRGIAVADLLASGWPLSLQLGGAALLLGVGLGLPMAAVLHSHGSPRARRWAEAAVDGLTCLPAFLLAPLLLLFSGLWQTPGSHSTGSVAASAGGFALAVAALAIPVMAATLRWTLHGLRFAAATPWWPALLVRGIPRHRLWWRYGLASARPTIIAGLAPVAAEVFAGAVAVESLTGLPGLGLRLAEATVHRDAPLLLGAVACAVVTVMLIQSVAEVWCLWLEQRRQPGGAR